MSPQQPLQFIHDQPNIGLPLHKELVVDLFAGGGEAEALVSVNAADIIKLRQRRAAQAPLD